MYEKMSDEELIEKTNKLASIQAMMGLEFTEHMACAVELANRLSSRPKDGSKPEREDGGVAEGLRRWAVNSSGYMDRHEDGRYVLFEDVRTKDTEVARLREALKRIASNPKPAPGDEYMEGVDAMAKIARAALKGAGHDD